MNAKIRNLNNVQYWDLLVWLHTENVAHHSYYNGGLWDVNVEADEEVIMFIRLKFGYE
jgi:hypothetical protein